MLSLAVVDPSRLEKSIRSTCQTVRNNPQTFHEKTKTYPSSLRKRKLTVLATAKSRSVPSHIPLHNNPVAMRKKLLERAKQLVGVKSSSGTVAMAIDVSVGRSAFLGWSSETSHSLREATDELDAVAVWPSTECQLIQALGCLLYTSPSPRDGLLSRMPSSA